MSKEFPLYVYIYNTEGYHGGKQIIKDETELRAMMLRIRSIVEEGREVMITDTGDFCVFHAKGGKVKWPTL
jgi:hypothetical protein